VKEDAMLTNTRTIRVEWGDCDPAGIVFYPRYFEMFEICIHSLVERATGMTKFQLTQKYGFVGFPVVQARAQFMAPATYGDEVVADTTITEFRRSSFDVTHRVHNGEKLAVEGFETRVWVARHPNDPNRIKAIPIPDEVIAKFKQG
jgi:4-hydroxybenzoyl-CoA thioesterase